MSALTDKELIAKLRDSATFISDTVVADKTGGWSNLRHLAADRLEQLIALPAEGEEPNLEGTVPPDATKWADGLADDLQRQNKTILVNRRALAQTLTAFAQEYSSQNDARWRANMTISAAALSMVRDAVQELFGPAASLESEDAVLLRGPEPTHEGQAIVDALMRVRARTDRDGVIEALRVAETALGEIAEIESEIDKQTYDQYSDLTHKGDADAPDDADLTLTIPVKTDRDWSKRFLAVDRALKAIRALRTAPAQDATAKIVAEIAAERQRQISVEGWTAEHDDKQAYGELARAAGAYCESAARPKLMKRAPGAAFTIPRLWPRDWSLDWWKPKNPRADLVRAGALIVAEIERLDRISVERGEHLKEKP